MKQCFKCKKEKGVEEFANIFHKNRGKFYRDNQCKECRYEYTRQWKSKNQDKVNKVDKEWRSKNIDKYNESQRKTYQKYIERRRKELVSYYYKMKERFGMSPATVYRNGGIKVVREVFAKYNNQCANCGTENKIHIHHIDNQGRHNLNKGLKPNNSLNNLILLCVRCHTSRHQEEKRYGLKN